MSLYNALFGTNPFSTLLLEALGAEDWHIPRFRDCYLSEDGSEIIIYTRTGGGNREEYEDENHFLTLEDGYKRDEDDDYDCTYAKFYYAVPEAFKPMALQLTQLGATKDPAKDWQTLLDNLKNGDADRPDVQRALKVGEQIFGVIREQQSKER